MQDLYHQPYILNIKPGCMNPPVFKKYQNWG